jgi:hypothetical protein
MINISKKNYTEYISLRLTKEEYDLLSKTLFWRKGDKINSHNHHIKYYKNTGYNKKNFLLNRSTKKTGMFLHSTWLKRIYTAYNTNWYYNDRFKLYRNTLLISNITGF